MFFSENPTKHNILKYTTLPGKFSYVLSASESSGEEWLSFSEKTAPGAFLKAARVSGKETKDSKWKKEGKKETGSRKKKRPAAESADAGADARTQKKPWSVSASGLLLKRRLPTLPLAQYHRRDEA